MIPPLQGIILLCFVVTSVELHARNTTTLLHTSGHFVVLAWLTYVCKYMSYTACAPPHHLNRFPSYVHIEHYLLHMYYGPLLFRIGGSELRKQFIYENKLRDNDDSTLSHSAHETSLTTTFFMFHYSAMVNIIFKMRLFGVVWFGVVKFAHHHLHSSSFFCFADFMDDTTIELPAISIAPSVLQQRFREDNMTKS